MANNFSTNASFASNENQTDDMAAFTKVVSAMSNLSSDARLRLFRTLATYFDIQQFGETPSRVAPVAQQTVVPAKEPTVPGFFSEDRSLTPKQFLFEKRPQTDTDRIVCLAYYLSHYREIQHFKTLDLSKLNTEAAQVKLSNPTVAVDYAASAGLLVQSGQGRKQISSIGELYVQALPDRVAAREAVAAARPRKPKVKSKPLASKRSVRSKS